MALLSSVLYYKSDTMPDRTTVRHPYQRLQGVSVFVDGVRMTIESFAAPRFLVILSQAFMPQRCWYEVSYLVHKRMSIFNLRRFVYNIRRFIECFL